MSRTTTTAAGNALAAGNVPMLIFVEMDFPSAFLRVNNSPQTFAWNGFDWLGVGALGSIDPIDEGATLESRGLKFRISGVPTANISVALNQKYQGRDCKVWLAPLDASYAIIDAPVMIFWGRLDVMEVDVGATATITVSAESRLADWDRPRTRRYTHEDQQIDYPGDKGFEFVPQMVDMELRWGY